MNFDNLITVSINFEQTIKSCIQSLASHQEEINNRISYIERKMKKHSAFISGIVIPKQENDKTLKNKISNSLSSIMNEDDEGSLLDLNNNEQEENETEKEKVSIIQELSDILENKKNQILKESKNDLLNNIENLQSKFVNDKSEGNSNKNEENYIDLIKKESKTLIEENKFDENNEKEISLKTKSSIKNNIKIEDNNQNNINNGNKSPIRSNLLKSKEPKTLQIKIKTTENLIPTLNLDKSYKTKQSFKTKKSKNNVNSINETEKPLETQFLSPIKQNRDSIVNNNLIFDENIMKINLLIKSYKAQKLLIKNQENKINTLENQQINFNNEIKQMLNNKQESNRLEERINLISDDLKILKDNSKNEENIIIMIKNTEKKLKSEISLLQDQIVSTIVKSKIPDIKKTIIDEVGINIDNKLQKLDFKITNNEQNNERMREEINCLRDTELISKQISKSSEIVNLKFLIEHNKIELNSLKDFIDAKNQDEIGASVNNLGSITNPSDIKKEITKINNSLVKKITDIEKKISSFIQSVNFDGLSKEVSVLRSTLKGYPDISEITDIMKNINTLFININQLREDFTLFVCNNKVSDDIIVQKKRIDILSSQFQKFKQEESGSKNKNEIDISHLLESIVFNEFRDKTKGEIDKIHRKIMDINDRNENFKQDFDTINANLQSQSDKDKEINKSILEINKKVNNDFVDVKTFTHKIKYYDEQIKRLIESYMKQLEKGETWILAKNKLHLMNCASCEKVISKGDNEPNPIKADHNCPNYNNLGNGYSKKLKSLNHKNILALSQAKANKTSHPLTNRDDFKNSIDIGTQKTKENLIESHVDDIYYNKIEKVEIKENDNLDGVSKIYKLKQGRSKVIGHNTNLSSIV